MSAADDEAEIQTLDALLERVLLRGYAIATWSGDEICFFCGAQKDFSAPKSDADHCDDCVYVAIKRHLGYPTAPEPTQEEQT